jgi:phosphocarrier protein
MLTQEIEIVNKLGLHARAAAKLVNLATAFEADVEIEKDGKRVNGKSIMSVMMLAASQGSTLTLHVDGSDENEAMEQVVELISIWSAINRKLQKSGCRKRNSSRKSSASTPPSRRRAHNCARCSRLSPATHPAISKRLSSRIC